MNIKKIELYMFASNYINYIIVDGFTKPNYSYPKLGMEADLPYPAPLVSMMSTFIELMCKAPLLDY